MSNDLRKIEQWQRDILLNKEVIAIDQDVLGKPGLRVTPGTDDAQVWVRPLSKGEFAVGLFNRGDAARDITCIFSVVSPSLHKAKIRDLWANKDLGEFSDQFEAKAVEGHDTVFLKFTPVT
jgi:alpha-galactosidase